VAKSIQLGVWATQPKNEHKLNTAFAVSTLNLFFAVQSQQIQCITPHPYPQNSKQVILIFSVNSSGHFHGFAEMTTPVGKRVSVQ
jgi:hypothetical protein